MALASLGAAGLVADRAEPACQAPISGVVQILEPHRGSGLNDPYFQRKPDATPSGLRDLNDTFLLPKTAPLPFGPGLSAVPHHLHPMRTLTP